MLVTNIGAQTDAGIGSGAVITAAGGSGTVTVSATATDSVDDLALAGAAGGVGVGGAVAVVNDSDSQNAHINNDASITQAAGGVFVEGVAVRNVSALTPAVALGAAAGIGVAVATVIVSGNDTATIGDVTVGGGGPVGTVDVEASDCPKGTAAANCAINVSAEAISGSTGVGAAIAGAVAWTDLSGETQASSGAHGAVGSGGMTVAAYGDNTSVTASTINIQVSGGVSLGLTIRHAQDDRTTEADTTASATPNVGLLTPGAVTVTATAQNDAQSKDLGPNISIGAGSIAVVYGLAEVGGATRVKLDGNVTGSSSITATASGEDQASSTVFQLGASIVGVGGVYADAEITSGAAIEALVGSDASLNSSGTVDVEAKTASASGPVANAASASVLSVNFGLDLSVSVMITKAVVNSDVKATLDGKVSGSGAITVKATGFNDANSTTITANLGSAAISASGASADVGQAAITQASAAGTSSLTSSGAITFTATSDNVADASSDGGTGGLVAIGINLPTATVQGATTASIGGNVTGSSSAVSATAQSDNQATADSFVVAVGLLGTGSGSNAQATITSNAATVAYGGAYTGGTYGAGGSWSVPAASVTFTATSANTSQASAAGGGGSLIASVSVMETTADVGAPTYAGFDATLSSGSSLSVESSAHNLAVANTDVYNVGLGISVSTPSATSDIAATAVTSAGIGANAQINVTGALLVQAQLSNGAGLGNWSVSGGCGCSSGTGSCSRRIHSRRRRRRRLSRRVLRGGERRCARASGAGR